MFFECVFLGSIREWRSYLFFFLFCSGGIICIFVISIRWFFRERVRSFGVGVVGVVFRVGGFFLCCVLLAVYRGGRL